MDLTEITNLESIIISQMPIQESLEQRDNHMLAHGIYASWQEVFKQYVISSISGNTESLKRALFMLWYQCSEPSDLSGIRDLNEADVHQVLLKVDTLASSDNLDHELTFMLPFYFQVCDWYFERFDNLLYLTQASKKQLELWQSEAPKSNWIDRGIMGDYWSTIGLNHSKES